MIMSKKNKISMQEYLEALKTVETYHCQLREESAKATDLQEKMLMLDVLLKEVDMPVRLQKIVNEYINTFGNTSMQNVNVYNFLKIRNAGKKSWADFEQIREEYMKKWADKSMTPFSNGQGAAE
jgi:hypothetical protein